MMIRLLTFEPTAFVFDGRAVTAPHGSVHIMVVDGTPMPPGAMRRARSHTRFLCPLIRRLAA